MVIALQSLSAMCQATKANYVRSEHRINALFVGTSEWILRAIIQRSCEPGLVEGEDNYTNISRPHDETRVSLTATAIQLGSVSLKPQARI
jgi:hypothetical protein